MIYSVHHPMIRSIQRATELSVLKQFMQTAETVNKDSKRFKQTVKLDDNHPEMELKIAETTYLQRLK